MDGSLDRQLLITLLAALGDVVDGETELTIVGGAAGMLLGELAATRTTVDCDVVRVEPADHWPLLQRLANELAQQHGLPPEWLNDRVTQLDVLPSGWRRRRVEIARLGRLRLWSVSRMDLLAMKVYAGRMQDRTDVLDMRPTREERTFVRRYLDQLRVPSLQANLDQVQSAFRFLEAMEDASP